MTLGKGLESLIPKNNQQNNQQGNNAPVLLPTTDTEQYHKLAPLVQPLSDVSIPVIPAQKYDIEDEKKKFLRSKENSRINFPYRSGKN